MSPSTGLKDRKREPAVQVGGAPLPVTGRSASKARSTLDEPQSRGLPERQYRRLAVCGICGIFQTGGRPPHVVEQDMLDAMTDGMTHRGPDDRGTVSRPGFALGVRRLRRGQSTEARA